MIISELNEAIRLMKTIYSFQDHITEIEMLENLRNGLPMVRLTTIDQVTGGNIVCEECEYYNEETEMCEYISCDPWECVECPRIEEI